MKRGVTGSLAFTSGKYEYYAVITASTPNCEKPADGLSFIRFVFRCPIARCFQLEALSSQQQEEGRQGSASTRVRLIGEYRATPDANRTEPLRDGISLTNRQHPQGL